MLKAKSNVFICALNLFLSPTQRYWSDNSPFSPCIIISLSCYLNISISIKYTFISSFYNKDKNNMQRSLDFITSSSCCPVPLFLYSKLPVKVVCTCCFQCILSVFSLNPLSSGFCTNLCSETPFPLITSFAQVPLPSLGPFPICLISSI